MTKTLNRIGAAAGIGYAVLQLAAQGLIQTSGIEPSFGAPASEILAFFQNQNSALFNADGYLSMLSTVVFLWFVGALWDEIRSMEGGNGWLSMIAVGSGIATEAAFNEGGWGLAVFRISDGFDPQIARLLIDQGNLNFAYMWVTVGSMVLTAGIIFHNADHFPKWLGRSSIVLALGLFAARAVWTSQIAFAPYVLFWVWMIVLGIKFFRRGGKQLD